MWILIAYRRLAFHAKIRAGIRDLRAAFAKRYKPGLRLEYDAIFYNDPYEADIISGFKGSPDYHHVMTVNRRFRLFDDLERASRDEYSRGQDFPGFHGTRSDPVMTRLRGAAQTSSAAVSDNAYGG